MLSTSELLTAGRRLKKLYDKMMDKTAVQYGLSRVDIAILLFLLNNPEYDTARDIVELRMLAKSHVSKGVENLVCRGYLMTYPDSSDRRVIHLRLTNDALPCAETARNVQNEFMKYLYKDVSESEKEMIAQISRKVLNNIEEALKHDF